MFNFAILRVAWIVALDHRRSSICFPFIHEPATISCIPTLEEFALLSCIRISQVEEAERFKRDSRKQR